jgi:hypothetical protein
MLAPSAPTSITLLTGKVVSTLAWITAMGSWFQFAFPQEVVGISDIQLFSCHLMTQKHYFVLPVINNGHMKLTFKKMLQLYTKMVIMYESTITEHFFHRVPANNFFIFEWWWVTVFLVTNQNICFMCWWDMVAWTLKWRIEIAFRAYLRICFCHVVFCCPLQVGNTIV